MELELLACVPKGIATARPFDSSRWPIVDQVVSAVKRADTNKLIRTSLAVCVHRSLGRLFTSAAAPLRRLFEWLVLL